jgi:16S rRNA G966 N2-methylase RsmD
VTRANVARCGVEGACIILADDFVGVHERRSLGGRYDLILLDPPYDFPDVIPALEGAAALVATGGLVVLEHRRSAAPPETIGRLMRRRTVRSGDSELSFYIEQVDTED